MNKKKEEIGITLVALVVTIVVLLILAGVSISLVLGNNGIVTKAREARDLYSLSGKKEKLDMVVQASMISSEGINLNELKENIKEQIPDAVVDGNSFPVIVDLGDEKVSISKDGNLQSCVKSVKLKVNNKEQEITEKNVADYYGREVENYAQNDTKYRLFYIDFEGKFGEMGTVYIMADYIAATESLSAYNAYQSNDIKTMKKLNPIWAEKDGNIDKKNKHVASWLCNTNEWKDYANENANYAVGGPSIEMFCKSYNQVYNANLKLDVNEIGYLISKNDKDYNPSMKNIYNDTTKSIYNTENVTYWMCSNAGSNEYCLNISDYNDKGIGDNGYGMVFGFRPIVSVKNNFKINLK